MHNGSSSDVSFSKPLMKEVEGLQIATQPAWNRRQPTARQLPACMQVVETSHIKIDASGCPLEAAVLTGLQHRGLVRVIDYAVCRPDPETDPAEACADGTLWLVMELCNAGTLQVTFSPQQSWPGPVLDLTRNLRVWGFGLCQAKH
jgi:hypothetical protein